jgi:P4 family phage/plasmid primase-like protien
MSALPPSLTGDSMLAWVLRYIRLGWPVFPLGVRSKLPMIPKDQGGNGCLDATLDETKVREWWGRWPKANIGIATGHRFFVFDVDPLNGGADSLEGLLHLHNAPLPDTIQQVTGKEGTHYLFRLAADFRVANTESYIGQGLDTRGFHGYIVAAPSIHPDTGRAYFWDGAVEIEQQQIAVAPGWMLDKLRQVGQRQQGPVAVPAKIPKGQQHRTLVSIAGSLRKRGLDAEAIFAALQVVNEKRCTEPGPERNIRRIAESVARYAPDARFDLFKAIPEKDEIRDSDVPPAAAGEEGAAGDATDAEIALSAADVEAAVDAAIAADDLPGAMKLAVDVGKLPDQAIEQSLALVKAKLKLKFKRDFTPRDFERAVRSAAAQHREPPPPSDDDDDTGFDGEVPDLTTQPLTDSGNGERIVLLHGKDIRFCTEFGKWLVWDGRRWKIDDAGTVTQRAKQMARLLHKQAKSKEDFKKLLQDHARASESHSAIVAALKRAATEPGIAVNASDLDQHRYLLNCLNGVVDLRTGELMPPERRYLITKLCHYNFKLDAQSPRFVKFLNWAMGESDAAECERVTRLVGFLQKSLGYSLTGDVSEKAAFVCYGRSGNNGKTTLLTIFTTILTEYATQLDINTLMTTKMTDNNMRADMAKLAGARLVITSEVDDAQKLSERLLKYLTAGMGKVVACRKFENPFEFDATHKIWMDCNYRPRVSGGDDAIWGRLMCVPFDQHLDKDDPAMDKKLKDKILAEGEGVLAWAVRGAMIWAKEGRLDNPPEIKAANAAWRAADDPLKDFLEDYCEVGDPDEGYWVLGSKLSTAYDQWCRENKEKFPLGRGQFSERLEMKGFKESRSRRDGRDKQMRTREGLRLREDVTLVSAPGRSQQGQSGF